MPHRQHRRANALLHLRQCSAQVTCAIRFLVKEQRGLFGLGNTHLPNRFAICLQIQGQRRTRQNKHHLRRLCTHKCCGQFGRVLLPRHQKPLLRLFRQVFKQQRRLSRVIVNPLLHPSGREQFAENELLHPRSNVIGSGQALIQPKTGHFGLLGIAPRKPPFPVLSNAPLGVQQIPLHELGSMLDAHPSTARRIERAELFGIRVQRQHTL